MIHPDQITPTWVKPNRIGVITSIAGSASMRIGQTEYRAVFMNEVPVGFIGRDEFLSNKEATGRAKDVGDAAELRKRTPNP